MRKKVFFWSVLSLASLGWGATQIFGLHNISFASSTAYIDFANAGGVFTSRQAVFRVSDKTTTTSIGNGLRLYEAHLGKMIEVTNHFCQDREPDYIVYWHYEADEGGVYMGKFALSCQFATETFQTFCTERNKEFAIYYGGYSSQENVATLALDRNNSKQFASLVQTIKPQCIGTTPEICPGDRYQNEESRNSGVRNSEVEIAAQNTTKEKEEEIFSGSYNWTPDGPTLFHSCGTGDSFDVSSKSATQELDEFYESYVDFMARNSSKFSNFGLNGTIYPFPWIYVKFHGQVLDEEPMMPSNEGVIRVSEVIEMYSLFPDNCR